MSSAVQEGLPHSLDTCWATMSCLELLLQLLYTASSFNSSFMLQPHAGQDGLLQHQSLQRC
jgi:hypothetical protein